MCYADRDRTGLLSRREALRSIHSPSWNRSGDWNRGGESWCDKAETVERTRFTKATFFYSWRDGWIGGWVDGWMDGSVLSFYVPDLT